MEPDVEIVVTGIGAIGPFGVGQDQLASALRTGCLTLAEVDGSAGYHLATSARLACLVPAVDLSRWVAPADARRLSRPSHLAVAASAMALEAASLPRKTDEGAVVSIALATAFGAVAYTERLLRQIFIEDAKAVSPFLFTECVANAPAAEVAIAAGARGTNATITQREAGPLIAVAKGGKDLRRGRAQRALVGAVEEMNPLLHALLDRYRALARSEENRPEVGRPLDRDRNGFVAAEGATVLVLETAAEARSRGAAPLARLRCAGSAFDPTASSTDWGDGFRSLGAALGSFLKRSGLHPRDIDVIVCGASGSRRGDRLEALTLREAWDGAALPPILCPKGVIGEYGGGILAPAVMALSEQPLSWPAAGFERADAELGVVPHTGGPLPAPARLLATGFAAGGAASWAVLERA